MKEQAARPTRMSLRALSVAAVILMVTAGAALALITPVKVVGGKETQYEPHGNGAWLTWGSNSIAHPKRWKVLAREASGTTVTKLNAAGTGGQPGGFDPGTDTVIYEQWTDSDGGIFLYDLATGTRTKAAGVNSLRYEGRPRISATYILFQRWVRRDGTWFIDLLLYDRGAGTTATLGSWRQAKRSVYTGSVGDRYATWTLCSDTDCWAYLYDADLDTKAQIGPDSGTYQYAPVIDEANGDVYFARSGPRCGYHAGIWWVSADNLNGTATKVAALPSGIDTGWTLSLAPGAVAGTLDILFERYNCSRRASDVYSVPGAVTLPGP